MMGTASRYITVLEGIEDYVGDDVRVLYSEGCHLYKDRTSNLAQENDRMSEVLGVCKESDVIVAVLGLDAGIEGEEGDAGNEYGSGDKPDLNLPWDAGGDLRGCCILWQACYFSSAIGKCTCGELGG